MVCPKCQTENPDAAVYCMRCSRQLTAVAEALAATVAITAGPTPATEFMPRPAAALIPGYVLGERYEIVRMLGRGGMGAVYEAIDRELGRSVALKVIRPELAEDAKVLQRFKQELILARQISHRNVIQIYDLGTLDGVCFISMEFVRGRDLGDVIEERKKLPAEEAARIMIHVCEGLRAAHAEKVVHRDLKPQNIMVQDNGNVVVMDFGIAKSDDTAAGLTRTGALLGTPAYMSP